MFGKYAFGNFTEHAAGHQTTRGGESRFLDGYNATVFRRRPFYNGRFFNIQADRKDGFLLPEDQRTFVVPRARQDGIGFGQANIWYAGTPECSEYVNKVIRYIESHA